MKLRWISVVAAVALIAGCTTSPENPPSAKDDRQFPNWPTLLDDFRFHWTASPGIDLMSGPAVIVRAYTESYQVASLTFDIKNVYPGFMRATPENQSRDGEFSSELIGIRPLWPYERDKPPPGVAHFGFNTDHLLELTATGDGYRAIVCTGSYSDFIKSTVQPDAYFSVASQLTQDGVHPTDPYPVDEFSGVSVRQIVFTQHDPRIPADAPAPVATAQRGPAPAPQIDVFGNWFVTASSTKGWGPAVSDTDAFPSADLKKRCSDAMPDDEAQRRALMTGYKKQPLPHGDAVPGWPLKVE